MTKKDTKQHFFTVIDGISTVKNQLIESYQSGVIDDQRHNNRGIDTFNNEKK